MMRVYLESLGCRLNYSELESLASRFLELGQTVVDDPIQADVCVVNTCAVTASAARKSRRRTRVLSRVNPMARIAVVGCFATMEPGICSTLPGVAWTVPNAEKDRTVEIIVAGSPPAASCLPARVRRLRSGDRGPSCRTRSFVKIQDGCDDHCTFCVVRSLRGSVRSVPLCDIVEKVRLLADGGTREVVLTGVNLGSYGRDLGLANGLHTLIEKMLACTGLLRLRLSSLEPWDIGDSFFELWESPRMCRQLHIPLQSGCDKTLRRMGRRTTAAEFARLVGVARDAIPDLAVTTDVMVGFPGEEDAAFHASYDFVQAMEFARLHVFSHSARPRTLAAGMLDQVGREVRDVRARVMRELGKKQAHRFAERYVGREMAVLWERRGHTGVWLGLTDNYLRVVTQAEENLHNQLTLTALVAARDGHLVGELVER